MNSILIAILAAVPVSPVLPKITLSPVPEVYHRYEYDEEDGVKFRKDYTFWAWRGRIRVEAKDLEHNNEAKLMCVVPRDFESKKYLDPALVTLHRIGDDPYPGSRGYNKSAPYVGLLITEIEGRNTLTTIVNGLKPGVYNIIVRLRFIQATHAPRAHPYVDNDFFRNAKLYLLKDLP